MNIRSMFGKLFKSVGAVGNTEQARLLNGYNNTYTPWDGNAYDDATVRACIDTIARHFGKMRPRHVIRRDGASGTTVYDGLNYIMGTKPNDIMTTSEFLEKTAAQYLSYNNAFIYPQRDERGALVALWPLNFAALEMREAGGDLYCKFTFGGGDQTTIPYENIVHIRRYFNRDDLWGDDSAKVLKEDINTLRAVRANVMNAVSNFAALRGILKWKGTIRPEDEKAAWARFVETYASGENGSGIGSLDNRADFQPINPTLTSFDSAQMEYMRANIYRHFGLNDKIVQGCYSEDEYIAFYESVLEPIAVKLAQELTDKLFTTRERGRGHEVILESNRLSYMSVASKIKVCAAMTPIGCISINEVRAMFGYAPVDGGDDRQVSLNYVKAGEQTAYQTGNPSAVKGGEADEEKGDANAGDNARDDPS